VTLKRVTMVLPVWEKKPRRVPPKTAASPTEAGSTEPVEPTAVHVPVWAEAAKAARKRATTARARILVFIYCLLSTDDQILCQIILKYNPLYAISSRPPSRFGFFWRVGFDAVTPEPGLFQTQVVNLDAADRRTGQRAVHSEEGGIIETRHGDIESVIG